MAVTFALDTSAYSGFVRGDASLKKWFKGSNKIIVPTIVIGELRAGFAAGSKTNENEELLARFLSSPNVEVVTITDTTTKAFANIFAELRRLGKPIGTDDMWIAAITVELDIPLLTLDSDFPRVSQLKLLDITQKGKL